MSTIDKALSILELFSESHPVLRSSEIARQLGWDKSNVQRYVTDLARRGLLEQEPETRAYCLGASLTRLAMIRDRTNPEAVETRKVLQGLVAATGETAHASRIIGGRLLTIDIVETIIRGTRVYIDEATPLPFHASGSGIAFLSATDPAACDRYLAGALQCFTENTPAIRDDIDESIRQAQADGYAKAEGTYEADVIGLGAPVRDYGGRAVGAVAVAIPLARFRTADEADIARVLQDAAARLSRFHGAA